jgi:hypothetical protein
LTFSYGSEMSLAEDLSPVSNPVRCCFIKQISNSGGLTGMAAFCSCCGAEITLKAEACPVCGTPRHGSLPSEKSSIPGASTDLSRKDAGSGSKLRRPPRRWHK